MRKIHIFTAIFAVIASVVFAGPAAALAQYYYLPVPPTSAQYSGQYAPVSGVYGCLSLTSNLYNGVSDVTTGGQVSMLQAFLIGRGYLAISTPTGYFGPVTANAVARYQAANGIPSDGTVGVLTRNSINAMSCGGGYGNNYYSTPVLKSLTPTSGKIGSSVTIHGSGFDRNDNTVNFGGVVMSGIRSSNGTTLRFTVPRVYNQNYNYSPYNYSYNNYNYNNQYCGYGYYSNCDDRYGMSGRYAVSVTNARGTSNSLYFTVLSSNSNDCYYNYDYDYRYDNRYDDCYDNDYGRVEITDVDGPSSLRVDREGQWDVEIDNPDRDRVTVTARWGDGTVSTMHSSTSRTDTLDFEHEYDRTGYYTIVFTATDDQGARTSVTEYVNVFN